MSFFYCHQCAVHPCTSHLNATFYHVVGFSSTLDVYPLQIVVPSLVVPSAVLRRYRETRSNQPNLTTDQPAPLNTDSEVANNTGARLLAHSVLRKVGDISSNGRNLTAPQPVPCHVGTEIANVTGAPADANSALLQDQEASFNDQNSITFPMDPTEMETGIENVTEAPTVANSALLQDQETTSNEVNTTTHHMDPIDVETGIANMTVDIKSENQELETLADDPLLSEAETNASTSATVAAVPKIMDQSGCVVYDYSHQEPKSPLNNQLEDDDDFPSSWSSTTVNVGSEAESPPIYDKETQVVEISAQKYYFERIKIEPETAPKTKCAQKGRKAAAKSKGKGVRRKRKASGTPEWLARLLRNSPRRNPSRRARMRPNHRYVDEIGGYVLQTPKRSPVTRPPKKTKRFRELFKPEATPSPPKLSPQEKGVFLFKQETPDSPELEQDRGPMSQDPLAMDGQEYVLRKILQNKKF